MRPRALTPPTLPRARLLAVAIAMAFVFIGGTLAATAIECVRTGRIR